MRFFADRTVTKNGAEALLSQQQSTSRPFTRTTSARYYFFRCQRTKEFVAQRQCSPRIGSPPYKTGYVYSILSITQEKNTVLFRWLTPLASSVLCVKHETHYLLGDFTRHAIQSVMSEVRKKDFALVHFL